MKIAMLLSGGVDSSVAMVNLKKDPQNEITAYYLKIWLQDDASFLGQCPWEEDLSYAREVCRQWDIPLKIIPLQREYYDRVVAYTIEELKQGGTPSPDIFCNQQIKFGVFLDHIPSDTDYIATGHYGIIKKDSQGISRLFMAKDPVKDQSYFLSHLSQNQLKKLIFPLGPFHKKEVRDLAQKYNLSNKNRKDSQGICFLGKIKYKDFVEHYLGSSQGNILDEENKTVLGTHRGVWFYTIGQRSGLGLSGGPWYVSGKDLDKNELYVSHKKYIQDYYQKEFTITRISWTTDRKPDGIDDKPLSFKLRHGPERIPGKITSLSDNDDLIISLEKGDKGIATGQYCIIYDDRECLGCGRIQLPREGIPKQGIPS